jgi:uncharacterized protein YkwD
MDYYEWINGHLLRLFFGEVKRLLGKDFWYNFDVALAASKHAEAMCKRYQLYHTPPELMGSALDENIVAAINSNLEDAVLQAARYLHNDPAHRHKMERFGEVGVGIAVDLERCIVYVVQRFK